MEKLIEKVMNDPDRIVRYNTKGRTGYIVSAKYPYPVGKEGREKVYNLKIILEDSLDFKNMYPFR